jgi:hypothetical protein
MLVAGADGQWEWPPAPAYHVQQAEGWRSGDFRETQLTGGNEDTSSGWKQQNRFDPDPQPTYPLGTIYPEIGDSARNSNALRADAQNLQTGTIWQTAAAAQLDDLYHPGTTVTMTSIVTAAATGRVRELGGSLTEAEVRAVLTEAGSPAEWIDDLVAISWCESKHSPSAIGDAGNSLGEWQLWGPWFAAAGEDPSKWSDPVVNARVAIYVRQVRGRFGGGGGWSCAGLNGID